MSVRTAPMELLRLPGANGSREVGIVRQQPPSLAGRFSPVSRNYAHRPPDWRCHPATVPVGR
jgi:hypothetical protein